VVIPIAIFTRIDASTASSSAFQLKSKSVHDHAGIRVHVRLESAFTMRWKPRSPSTGICNDRQSPSEAFDQQLLEQIQILYNDAKEVNKKTKP
jgi:hypothetical protein